jgi:hypothetical protein
MPEIPEKTRPAWPDWREPEQYRNLLDLDRAGWAWEWVRRHPDYKGEIDDEMRRDGAVSPSSFQQIGLTQTQYDRALHWGLCFRRRFELPRHAGAVAVG